MPTDLAPLESDIRKIHGVMGVVILDDGTGQSFEVQVFTKAGIEERTVRQEVARVLSQHGLMQSTSRVFVFQFAGGDGELKRAFRRPVIAKIGLTSTGPNAEAEVNLVLDGKESAGLGSGPRTSYSLRVVAATTLEAAQAFLGSKGLFALEGASVVEVLERQVVLVLVNSALGDGDVVLGAALVGESPVHEATVRATLDAVNRHLSLALS